MTMEKGNISITPTKKGFAALLQYTKPNGQPGQMPITDFKFTDTRYQGSCEFERDSGRIIKLIAHDGTVLIDKSAVSPANIAAGASTRGYVDTMRNTSDILHIQDTFLPRDIQEIADYIHRQGIDNFALKLNKAARFSQRMNKFEFYQQRDNRFCKPAYHLLPITALAKRQKQNAAKLYPFIQEAVFQPDWRLVVGLGGESVYETSITLHHIYGLPYIPGSSIKGVVRSWVLSNIYLPQIPENEEKRSEKAEELACKDSAFKTWFGSQEQAGKVIFFDAFPIDTPTIEPDVMNPHYQEYYDGKKPPVDYLKTNPIPFLTVRNCRFVFILGTQERKCFEDYRIDGKDLGKWLKEALEEHGIGAKTAVGYGYMKKTE